MLIRDVDFGDFTTIAEVGPSYTESKSDYISRTFINTAADLSLKYDHVIKQNLAGVVFGHWGMIMVGKACGIC